MSRTAELEAEIELLKDRRTAVEAEAERAHDIDIMEAALQASDDITDEICALRRELDELDDMSAMRETARDRAWHQGRIL